jgi:hypothetical protein
MNESMECMQIQMSMALKSRAGRFYYAAVQMPPLKIHHPWKHQA